MSYHFVPGVSLRDFALKDAQGNKGLISTNDKEPSILKTGKQHRLLTCMLTQLCTEGGCLAWLVLTQWLHWGCNACSVFACVFCC